LWWHREHSLLVLNSSISTTPRSLVSEGLEPKNVPHIFPLATVAARSIRPEEPLESATLKWRRFQRSASRPFPVGQSFSAFSLEKGMAWRASNRDKDGGGAAGARPSSAAAVPRVKPTVEVIAQVGSAGSPLSTAGSAAA
jgi:hypothetical protein